jgi:hypothetical protein
VTPGPVPKRELPTSLSGAVDWLEELDKRLSYHERLLPMFLAAQGRQETMLLEISAAVGARKPPGRLWPALARAAAAGVVCAAIVGIGYTARADLRAVAAEAAERAAERVISARRTP